MNDVIPQHLQSEVEVLNNSNGQRVFILGTAHISKQSCIDASELVRSVKPAAVFLELCEQRRGLLDTNNNNEEKVVNTEEIMRRLIKGEDNLFAVIYAYLLREIAKDLEVTPGGEFKAAFEAANDTDAVVVLGDR